MILTVFFAVLFVASMLYNFLYRRQVRDLVSQLRFHKYEDSNREITTELKNRGVKDLQDELNALLEKQRKQRIIYEKKEEEIVRMVTDISHDIRTPLTSVIGYFQLLEECETDTEREHYKEIIFQRLQTLKLMLDEFFTYSKVSNNSYAVKKDICDVRQILCETLFLFYDELTVKGIETRIDIPEERFEWGGNEEAFNRIFMNLMKNVLSHGSGEVFISMKKYSVENGEKSIRISFENRTEEALPTELSTVFQRFYKGDSARSNQTSTGLGLCIVKELVEQMGGNVSAFSRGTGWFGIELRF